MTEYLTIPNFKKWQHYKDRCPPWIKLHRDILNDYKYSCLNDSSKLHLIMIWLLASQMENKIPYDAKWIEKKINASSKLNLKLLIEQGFINVASDLLAEGSISAIAEAEAEAEAKREAEKSAARERLVIAKSALLYLNGEAGKNFKATETNLGFILDRIKEGYELTDFKKAVDNQVTEWKNDEKMNKFLRPSTIFQKSKFDGYVNNNIKPTTDDGYVWGQGLGTDQ